MTRAKGLIFQQINIGVVLLGTPQYAQYIQHEVTFVLLYVPFEDFGCDKRRVALE